VKILSWFLSLALAAPWSDVSRETGVTLAPVGRAQLIDVNQDGWLDLVVNGEVRLNRGRGPGFSDQPQRPFGKDVISFVLWGDLNNDGALDAITVAPGRSHTVYKGPGFGMSSSLDIPSDSNTLAGVLADLDLDGRLDMAFGQAYIKDSLEAQQMRVYRGPGLNDVTSLWGFFTPGPPGAADGARPLYGLSTSDLDNDGYPELLGAAYGRQWNTLWKRSPTTSRFSECAAKFGVDGDAIRHGTYSEATREKFRKRNIPRPDELPFRSNGNTFCLAPADFDGDGDIDLFSADITHAWAGDSSDLSALLINRLEKFEVPFFERCIEVLAVPDPETGFRARPTRGLARDHSPQTPDNWNQGDLQAHWADLDCDGLLDLVVCESDYPHNRLRIFLQRLDHTFRESDSLQFPNCPGVAVGDYDRDGDLDLLTTGTRTRWPEAREAPQLALWQNQSSAGFLCIRLIGNGKSANRDAIGARVYLSTDQGKQSREVQGPYGHWGQQTQPGEVHFGLGNARPTSLTVVWPDQNRSQITLESPPSRGWLVIAQDQGLLESMTSFDPKRWSRTTAHQGAVTPGQAR